MLANILTYSRFAAVVPLWWLLANQNFWGAAALIACAGATDYLDGYLARRLRCESAHGAQMDYLADKAFSLSALAGMLLWAVRDPVLWWLMAVLFCTIALYDAFNATVRAEIARRVVAALRGVHLPVTTLSKAKTALVFVILVFASLSHGQGMLFWYAAFIFGAAGLLLVVYLLVRNVAHAVRQLGGA